MSVNGGTFEMGSLNLKTGILRNSFKNGDLKIKI